MTWSTPITGYGEFEGLRLPVRGKAVWKLPDGDLEYIDVTVTEHDAGAADQLSAHAAERKTEEGTGLRGE